MLKRALTGLIVAAAFVGPATAAHAGVITVQAIVSLPSAPDVRQVVEDPVCAPRQSADAYVGSTTAGEATTPTCVSDLDAGYTVYADGYRHHGSADIQP
jgi:hypothetical protein